MNFYVVYALAKHMDPQGDQLSHYTHLSTATIWKHWCTVAAYEYTRLEA